MRSFLNEGTIEQHALNWFGELGYEVIFREQTSVDSDPLKRKDNSEVVLLDRLKQKIDDLNPEIPKDAREEAIKKLLRTNSQKLLENNISFHDLLVNGVNVSYRRENGDIKHDYVRLFDFNSPNNNEFLAVNQFTVEEKEYKKRPDVVLFINGLPLVVIELKNPSNEETSIRPAYRQIETYKEYIPSLFKYNEIVIISDGLEAKAGTISSDESRFMAWKTVDGKQAEYLSQLEVLVRGMLNKETLLDLIRNFLVYETDKAKTIKKLGAYHQYNAVNNLIKSTIKAVNSTDKRAGVVWHTQGSGKSLTMILYSGKIIQQLNNNPTIIVLTDRNDLDDQLFNNFANCKQILRQDPIQAESRGDLKEKLKRVSGGIIFTTIQKFAPEEDKQAEQISDRNNILVIVDEAHRSQYNFIDGSARFIRDSLPNATFIGFTGTPIEKKDRNTKNVFGDYADIYDITQSVKDKMTVPIYYESRLAKLRLKTESQITLDKDFKEILENDSEEVSETDEETKKDKVNKSKWAKLERIVGHQERISSIAKDIVEHFENRQEVMPGKGLIVCMSRRICVDLYNEIIKLRPNWYNEDDKKGYLKVVMTGSSDDPLEYQPHIRNKPKRREIGDIFKDTTSELKLVIVRDMWLTGFDVPSMHTMYLDKPMQGHNLMQAIARVNRVFKDKQGGLVVDYLGIATQLREALSNYSESDQLKTGIPIDKAINIMLEKYDVVKSMFFGFDYDVTIEKSKRLNLILNAMQHILSQEKGKERFVREVIALSQAFALVVPHEKALEIRDEVGFFQAVKAGIIKNTISRNIEQIDSMDSAINQLISGAIVSDGVIDVLKVAGIKKPDLSILSEEFVKKIKDLPQKDLAMEVLRKLINDDIKVRFKTNIVKQKSFREMLEQLIIAYTNRSIQTVEVIEELLKIAKEIQDTSLKKDELNLTDNELAFYDALTENKSAVEVMGVDSLKAIAVMLTDQIHKNTNIDWNVRESERAKIRLLVKKILNRFGYPPDMQDEAIKLVLEQAETICDEGLNE